MGQQPPPGIPGWARTLEQGTGRVVLLPDRVRLLRPSADKSAYANAQLYDREGVLGWRPPLVLTIRARFSHPLARLRGTAGFGFWNAALTPGVRGLRAPRTAWFFFGGPPHDVPLTIGVPGRGFKAAILDAQRPAFYALLPAAPIGFLLMRSPALYRRLWPIAQRAIRAREALLDHLDVTAPHTYTLHWEDRDARFAVDGATVLEAPAPAGPLRFVAWIDNAYAVATPRGRFGLGQVGEPEAQWLDVESIVLEEGAA